MPPDLQPSIATEGLVPYLDRTAAAHNGHTGAEVVGWIKEGINAGELARRLGVSRMTAAKYKLIHKSEKNK